MDPIQEAVFGWGRAEPLSLATRRVGYHPST